MIHQKGISYPPALRKRLEEGALKQQQAVFELFKRNKSQPFPVFRVKAILRISRMTSARRAVTNLTYNGNSKHAKKNRHLGKYGRAPIYKTDKKVMNEDETALVSTWQWNPDYGEPKPLAGEQSTMFEPVKRSRAYNV